MLARRFLWIIAGLIVLVIAAAIVYRLFGTELVRTAMVPSVSFEESPQPAGRSYAAADMWIARPDIPDNPALWLPTGVKQETIEGPKASVFFVHPTSYLDRSRWNAALDDKEARDRADLFVRSQASAFNHVGEVWAPRYRQATFGAFLTTRADANKALDFAYRDVAAAFEAFLLMAPRDRPIILAGHSQGSLHLMRLLAERIAGKPEAERIAAAYLLGWPISKTGDVAALGLPACEEAGQAGCILSWQSFAEPADPGLVTDVYDASTGYDGRPRAGSPMVCVNPLTGHAGDEAEASANLGTLVPNEELTEARIVTPGVPARCDIRGFLLVGEDAPDLGPYVLPGNNYHVYDYALFWMNIRRDVAARLAAFGAQ